MARRRCAFEVGSVYASSCLRARAPTCGGALSDGPSMQMATPAGSTYCCASRSQSSGEAQARATAACTRGSSSREGFPSSRTATALTLGNRSSARTDFRKATFFCTESTRTTSRSGRAMATGIPGKPAPVPASRRLPEGSTGTTASESRTCFSATSSGSVMAVRFTDLFHFSIKSTCRPSCLSWSGPSRTPICAAPSPIFASRAASTLTSHPGRTGRSPEPASTAPRRSRPRSAPGRTPRPPPGRRRRRAVAEGRRRAPAPRARSPGRWSARRRGFPGPGSCASQSPRRPWLRMACSTSSPCSARYASTSASVTPRSRRIPSYRALVADTPLRLRRTAFTTAAPKSGFFLADFPAVSPMRSNAQLGTPRCRAATALAVVFLLVDLDGLVARLGRVELAAEVHLLRDGEDVVGEDVEGEAGGQVEHEQREEAAHHVPHDLLARIRHGRRREHLRQDHRDAHGDR